MIDPGVYDNFDDSADRNIPVGELSDEVIAIGASHAIPAYIREFMRRKYGAENFKTEEQIAAEEQAEIEKSYLRADQAEGIDPETDDVRDI